MCKRMLAWLSLALWAVLVVAVAAILVRGRSVAAADTRQVVELNQEEREAVLKEMRGMLTSLQGITAGLAAHDMSQVADSAKASGMAEAADSALEAKLPPAWKNLATAVHGGFDAVARAAAAGSSPDQILAKVNTGLQSCIACHAAYRLP